MLGVAGGAGARGVSAGGGETVDGGWGGSGRTVCEGFLALGEEGEGGCSEGKGFEHEEQKDEELHDVDGFKGGWRSAALTPSLCLISSTEGDDE